VYFDGVYGSRWVFSFFLSPSFFPPYNCYAYSDTDVDTDANSPLLKGSFDQIYKSPTSSLRGPIPIRIVRRVAQSVLQGLAFLYKEGVIHRGE
jgi:hypothetical protein